MDRNVVRGVIIWLVSVERTLTGVVVWLAGGVVSGLRGVVVWTARAALSVRRGVVIWFHDGARLALRVGA